MFPVRVCHIYAILGWPNFAGGQVVITEGPFATPLVQEGEVVVLACPGFPKEPGEVIPPGY